MSTNARCATGTDPARAPVTTPTAPTFAAARICLELNWQPTDICAKISTNVASTMVGAPTRASTPWARLTVPVQKATCSPMTGKRAKVRSPLHANPLFVLTCVFLSSLKMILLLLFFYIQTLTNAITAQTKMIPIDCVPAFAETRLDLSFASILTRNPYPVSRATTMKIKTVIVMVTFRRFSSMFVDKYSAGVVYKLPFCVSH